MKIHREIYGNDSFSEDIFIGDCLSKKYHLISLSNVFDVASRNDLFRLRRKYIEIGAMPYRLDGRKASRMTYPLEQIRAKRRRCYGHRCCVVSPERRSCALYIPQAGRQLPVSIRYLAEPILWPGAFLLECQQS
jgi:hypothetical protein